jgi:hypothetical protein
MSKSFYLYDINSKKYLTYSDDVSKLYPDTNPMTKFLFDKDPEPNSQNNYFINISSLINSEPDSNLIYDSNYQLIVSNLKSKSFTIKDNGNNTISIYDLSGKYFIRMFTPYPEDNPQYKIYMLMDEGIPTSFFKKYPGGPDYKNPTNIKYSCGTFKGCYGDINGTYDTLSECKSNCKSDLNLMLLLSGVFIGIGILIGIFYFRNKFTKEPQV